MPRYKRTALDAELDVSVEPSMPPEQREMLTRLRNMWEFASLMQYIFMFGHVVKIDDDIDIEELEAECLKPSPSEKLPQIGLQLLKYVSSHRGLTPDIFDEYTRRQYLAKAPQRNPFGVEEDATSFNELDVYTRIQVLQQLSTWTLGNAERIRGMMPQDEDHLAWRMEPLGWDRDDRAYYVLDDNRLYRRAGVPLPPPTPPKPKAKAKTKAKSKATKNTRSRATRASKRRKVEDTDDEEPDEEVREGQIDDDDTIVTNGETLQSEEESGYGFTSKTWECIAITLEEYQDFMASIFRSRDPNEKQLYKRIESDVLPIIEKRAEVLKAKQMKKLREMENMQKMATAKRSSRLAGKAEKEAEERAAREADEKRQAELRMAHEEQERQKRIEEGHESRRLTREQRVREREAKRILHEEELAKLEEEAERGESQGVDSDAGDTKRASERQRKTQQEQHKKELQALAEDDGNWYFDCSVCGKHGENMDDGTHSIACDKCGVWQHSKCHGFSPKQAEGEGFIFICRTCKRKEEDAKKPKIPPLKLHNRTSGSPESQKSSSRPATGNGQLANRLPDHVARQLDALHDQRPSQSAGPFAPSNTDHGQSPQDWQQGSLGSRYPPVSNFAPHASQQVWQDDGRIPPPQRIPGSQVGPNGYAVHQHQHQYAHQTAVASAGGHPQANGFSPRASAGQYAFSQSHYQQQHQPRPSQFGHEHPQPGQYYPQQQLSGSEQLMNGFQSPVKAATRPEPSAPSLQHNQPPQGYSPQQSQQHVQRLQQSPHTLLPPPAQVYQQRFAQSPTKFSPPQAPQTAPYQRPSPNAPRIVQTPKHLQPPDNCQQSDHTANGSDQYHTPEQLARPSSANGAANATSVAADGMAGPWPEGSKAIPQKHDQSPAPSSSVQSIDNTKIFPPNKSLEPSPSQQAAGAVSSVPVKKMPGLALEAKPRQHDLPHNELETQAQVHAHLHTPLLQPAQNSPEQHPQ